MSRRTSSASTSAAARSRRSSTIPTSANRLSPQQQARLLDRPDIIRAVGQDTVAAHGTRCRPSRPRGRRRARARARARDADRHVPRGEAVRLEDDDVVVGLRAPRTSPATTSCSSCTSSQSSTPCSTGSIRSPDSSRASSTRVAADERRALEHGVVELALRRMVRADRADERALSQPVAAQHRILRSRRRDDDVARSTASRCDSAGLGADARAELLERRLRAAEGDDLLERRHRGADALHLRLRLEAAADDRRAGARPRARDTSPRRRSRRRCAAARAGSPRSRRCTSPVAPSKSDDDEVPRRTSCSPRRRARGRTRP